MSAASAFDGYEFTAGSVRGLRAFRVDSLGRLTGCTYRKPWRPGENVAACHKGEAAARTIMIPGALYGSQTFGWQFASGGVEPKSEAADQQKPHSLEDCGCGFYAFYDGSNDYAGDEGPVSGVIEGYGKTVVGTRGFRCEKARIVALCIPEEKPEPRKRWDSSSWDRYPGHFAALSLQVFLVAVLMALAITDPSWWRLVGLFNVAALVWHAWHLWDIRRARKVARTGCKEPRYHAALLCGCSKRMRKAVRNTLTPQPTSSALLDKVRRNYSGIPVFTSQTEMVAAFPPDKGVEPAPETDPEFWTRSAS